MKLKNLAKEPLIHFLVVGALLFLLSALWNNGDRSGSDNQIVVTPQRIAHLQQGWVKQWGRPPTKQELSGLIDSFVEEEMLYREGLALGLEKDDTIVRRRIAQKVKFLIEDIGAPPEPEEKTLREFYEQQGQQFQKPARRSFIQVYFSDDRRGEKVEQDARLALRRLEKGDDAAAEKMGDSSMLEQRFVLAEHRDVSRSFGQAFADSLFSLEVGKWQGPVRSGFGLHLVRVSEEIPETTPELGEVRQEVLAVYLDEERRRRNDQTMQKLQDRYQVVVEAAENNSQEKPQATAQTVSSDKSDSKS